jgi:hypothetical protein
VCKLADRAVRQRWPEARVDELDEALPIGLATVELPLVEPELSVLQEVEHCVGDLLVLWRAAQMKKSLTAIEPGEWVPLAVELGKFQLVCGATVVIASAAFVVVAAPLSRELPSATAILQRVLDSCQDQFQSNLLLTLFHECGRQLRHLVGQGLEGAHHCFDRR